jgi:hypothetical protein
MFPAALYARVSTSELSERDAHSSTLQSDQVTGIIGFAQGYCL